jgi:hypothetical protein
MLSKTLRRTGLALLALTGAGLGVYQVARIEMTAPPMESETAQSHTLPPAAVPEVGEAIAAAWRGEPVEQSSLPPRLLDPNQGVYVAARRGGFLVTETWGPEGGTVWDGLLGALDAIRADVPASPPDTLQIDLVHSVRQHSYAEDSDWLHTNLFRGVRGLAIQTLSGTHRLAPSQAIAENRTAEDFFDAAIPLPAFLGGGEHETRARQRYASFGADQLLVILRPEPHTVKMLRGNTQVHMSDVSAQRIEETVALQAGWLQRTQQSSGRMTYIYLPSEERRNTGKDNMIRRWMASAALVRWAKYTGEESDWESATRSINHNLDTHYTQEGELGIVRYQGKSKLGALGIAAYTLRIHREGSQWAEQERSLSAAIDTLVDEDGSMQSWLSHPNGHVGDQNNFYPGEALFYWAQVLSEQDDPELLERYMRSFRYYREWHLKKANRNPAFVPWHTQAHFQVWQKTQDPELAAFILEMNDWLLDVQQFDDAPFPDTRGRFYKLGSGFGPPHASATGVYMEGLVDAWRLATALQDEPRAEAYRIALLRAVRSIMQLQFADDVDLFYVEDRQMVRGGIRTRVWDNEIRCDNVQHAMMGMIKMLQHMPAAALSTQFSVADEGVGAPER